MKKSNIGLLLFLIAVIAWLGVVRTLVADFSDKLLQAKVKSVEVASYKQRVVHVEQAQNQGEAIQSTIRSLYLAMPKSSQIPEVLVMIESLGNQAGVVFGSASIGTPTGQEVPVTVSFTGGLDTVNRFMNALHTNIRTATVKSQNVSSDRAGNLTVSLQLGLAYQGEKLDEN